MFFQKRKRRGPAAQGGSGAAGPRPLPESYFIGHDDLLKGSIVPRGRKKVRQFAVLVDTRVRVVTSGDVVERAVYEALVAAGAVTPAPSAPTETPATLEDDEE